MCTHWKERTPFLKPHDVKLGHYYMVTNGYHGRRTTSLSLSLVVVVYYYCFLFLSINHTYNKVDRKWDRRWVHQQNKHTPNLTRDQYGSRLVEVGSSEEALMYRCVVSGGKTCLCLTVWSLHCNCLFNFLSLSRVPSSPVSLFDIK